MKRVVVDVDVGADDYLALLVLLHAEKCGELKIEAIMCSMGNTTVENVCKNVVRLLETVGRTDIPVYKGASKQLIPPDHKVQQYHGSDGLGGLEHSSTPDTSIIKSEPAATAMANLVLNNPNEITIIGVAPLTNIAMAIRLYENFALAVKDVWIMGGNYTGIGNVTPAAEYNFYLDPEAAYIVLKTIKKPIFILPWEVCLESKISMDWRCNIFGAKNEPALQLLMRVDLVVNSPTEEFWYPCDAFLAAAFVYPERVITKKSTHNASVELHGSQTRGQVVLDHLQLKADNVTIIEKIDLPLFQELLMQL